MVVEHGMHIRDALSMIRSEVTTRMHNVEGANYGHAGDLAHVRTQLREITDFLAITQEGA